MIFGMAYLESNRKRDKMEKFCSNCGKPLDEDSTFCGYCGIPVSGKPTPQRVSNIPDKRLNTASRRTGVVVKVVGILSVVLIIGILIVIMKGRMSEDEPDVAAMTNSDSAEKSTNNAENETPWVNSMEAKTEEKTEEKTLAESQEELQEEPTETTQLDTQKQKEESLVTDGVDGIVSAESLLLEEISGKWSGVITQNSSGEAVLDMSIELILTPESESSGTLLFKSFGGTYANGDSFEDTEEHTLEFTYENDTLYFTVSDNGLTFSVIFIKDNGEVYGYGYTDEVNQTYYGIVMFRD